MALCLLGTFELIVIPTENCTVLLFECPKTECLLRAIITTYNVGLSSTPALLLCHNCYYLISLYFEERPFHENLQLGSAFRKGRLYEKVLLPFSLYSIPRAGNSPSLTFTRCAAMQRTHVQHEQGIPSQYSEHAH